MRLVYLFNHERQLEALERGELGDGRGRVELGRLHQTARLCPVAQPAQNRGQLRESERRRSAERRMAPFGKGRFYAASIRLAACHDGIFREGLHLLEFQRAGRGLEHDGSSLGDELFGGVGSDLEGHAELGHIAARLQKPDGAPNAVDLLAGLLELSDREPPPGQFEDRIPTPNTSMRP